MIEWRPIPGFPGYEAAADGRIRRLHRTRKSAAGSLVAQSPVGGGYLSVRIFVNGRRVCRIAHRLVALAFLGAPPTPKHQAAHRDGDRRNNRADNLRWATCRENHADRRAHGTDPTGTRNGRAKLDAIDVAEIRALREENVPARAIGRHYGISHRQVLRVAAREQWRGAR